MEEPNDFYQKVYAVVRRIPYGRVTTYGAIARYLGSTVSARTVGWALNASHRLRKPIPAHRVVNRNGILTGKHHFATPTLMQELLEQEGIVVRDDCVQRFARFFWDPCQLEPKHRFGNEEKAKFPLKRKRQQLG